LRDLADEEEGRELKRKISVKGGKNELLELRVGVLRVALSV